MDAVDTLIEVDEVDAVIGGHASNIRDAVSQRISSRLPYIYTSQYEGISCGPSTVAIGSTDRDIMKRLALQWLRTEKRAERYFFVGNDYIWPRMALATTRRLMRDQGTNLVGQAIVSTGDFDYEALLRRIARSGAQVVVQALIGLCSVEFNRAFAAAGLDEKMLRFGLIVDETIICGIGADASTNLSSPSPITSATITPARTTIFSSSITTRLAIWRRRPLPVRWGSMRGCMCSPVWRTTLEPGTAVHWLAISPAR